LKNGWFGRASIRPIFPIVRSDPSFMTSFHPIRTQLKEDGGASMKGLPRHKHQLGLRLSGCPHERDLGMQRNPGAGKLALPARVPKLKHRRSRARWKVGKIGRRAVDWNPHHTWF
jgi:hypothetical protein